MGTHPNNLTTTNFLVFPLWYLGITQLPSSRCWIQTQLKVELYSHRTSHKEWTLLFLSKWYCRPKWLLPICLPNIFYCYSQTWWGYSPSLYWSLPLGYFLEDGRQWKSYALSCASSEYFQLDEMWIEPLISDYLSGVSKLVEHILSHKFCYLLLDCYLFNPFFSPIFQVVSLDYDVLFLTLWWINGTNEFHAWLVKWL